MAHHAYLYVGGQEQGIEAARSYAASHLGIEGSDTPDIAVFAYEGLFPVAVARRVISFAAQAPSKGDQKLIVLAGGRIQHEAQNALLKLFEEPSEGTTLVLVVPSAGIILPTLASRLIEFPHEQQARSAAADAFLAASPAERAKLVTKLVARTKSDKDDEKQAARTEAVHICGSLIEAAYAKRRTASGAKAHELDNFLSDLDRFMPILHTSSAPLKLIFEHILLVMPEGLTK